MKYRNRTLTEGNPTRLILLFAIPIFIGNLFQIFYSLIDTKIVGSILGETALAAVGSVSTLNNLMIGFFNGLTLGFSVVLARFFGSGDEKAFKKYVAGAIELGFLTAIVVIGVVFLGLEQILHFMNVPSDQFGMAKEYIAILTAGMFITLSYNLCANILRAIGDSVTPLIFLVIASLANILLDYCFILGLGLGVKGAAVATVLSQLLSVVLCLLRIVKAFPMLHVKKSDFKLTWECAAKLYESGLSMGLMSSLVNVGTLILQTGINQLGTNIIVAHTAARKVFEIWALPSSVLGSSMATYCGQNYGAHRHDRIRQGIRSVLKIGACWAVMVFIMSQTISRYLISFIASTQNEEIITWGAAYLKTDMAFMIVCVLIVILRNSMQGFGDAKTPIVSSAIELCGKIIFALFLVEKFGYWAIIWTEPVIWICMVIPLIVMTLRNPVMKEKEKDSECTYEE